MTVCGINQQILGAIFRFLSESDVPAACRISRACQQAMQGVKSSYERQLSLSDDQRLVTFDTRFGLNALVREISLKHQTECEGMLNAIVVPPAAIFPGSADAYQLLKRHWECLSLHLLNSDEPAQKRFVVFCETFMAHLDNCSFSQVGAWVPDNDWAILRETETERRLRRDDPAWWRRYLRDFGTDKQKGAEALLNNQRAFLNLTVEYLKNFFVQERVARHYQRSFQAPALSHTQKWDHFYSNQLASARQTLGGAADITRYLRNSENRSPIQRFIRTEEIILSHEEELNNDLELLCQALVASGVPIPDGSTYRKRFWLNNNANVLELSRVENLTFTNFNRIPPEIGRLRGLKSLKIEKTLFSESSLTSLPPQLADLPRLSTLIINGSRFPVMPPILEQLPSLSYLVIKENEPPIRQISDALATKTQTSGLLAHLCGAWGEITGGRAGYPQGSPWYSTYHYLGLDPQHLTDVPFFTWFRGAFSIPYLPTPSILTILASPFGVALSPLTKLPVVGEWIATFFTAILLIPGLIITGLITLTVNPIILLLNLLINYGIEPLVQLCAPRMKHIQDAPAAP